MSAPMAKTRRSELAEIELADERAACPFLLARLLGYAPGLFLGTAERVLVGHADGRVDVMLREER